MVVSDYMTRNVTTLKDDAKFARRSPAYTPDREAPRPHPLRADDGKVVGIISDRDVSRLSPSILSEQTQEEYNRIFESTPITMAMTRSPITIAPSAPIADAAQLLYTKKIGGLLVVVDDELKGILTVTDMLGLLNELLAGNDGKTDNATMGV